MKKLIDRLALEPRPLAAAVFFLAVAVSVALTIEGIFLLPLAVIAAFWMGMLVPPDRREQASQDTQRKNLGDGLDRQVRNGRRLAILDPQTALLQRWYFELRVAEEARRCKRYGMNMAVVFLNVHDSIDPERQWPDSELEFVQLFAQTLRSVDLASRINAGEYAVCLPQTGEEGADTAALRLLKNASDYAVTAYMALCPRDGEDYETLTRSAHVYIPSIPASELDCPLEDEPEPVPPALDLTDYKDVARLIQESPSGKVTVIEGESVRSTRARLRRAAKHCGIAIRVWEEDGALHFEHTAKAVQSGAA